MISLTPTTTLLLNKWRQNKLAPFYIIRCPILQASLNLSTWSLEFITQLLEEKFSLTQVESAHKVEIGHPDILNIFKEKDEKEYKVSNLAIKEFIALQNYSPGNLEHRFIFFHDAQDISRILSNKLLKVLEEPQTKTTVFFLNSSNKPMLPTIESRAINLRHQLEKSLDPEIQPHFYDYFCHYFDYHKVNHPKGFLEALEKKQLGTLTELLKKDTSFQDAFIQCSNKFMTGHHNTMEQKSRWLDEIKHFVDAATYHNYPQERFFGLLQSIL